MRTYKQPISKNTLQCENCGLVKGHCICDYEIRLESQVEFWLLTHENEFSRTNNTGRLIENAIQTTRVFCWKRHEPPQELLELLKEYVVYLIFSADKEEDKKRVTDYKPSNKKIAFLILDGTWKEARKMIRKSDYLRTLPILSLNPSRKTAYDLRRNNDVHHICTVEVGIELLKLIGETKQAESLKDYFNYYLEKYHAGKYEHREVKNDKTII